MHVSPSLLSLILLTASIWHVYGLCSETLQQGSRGDCVKVLQRAVGTSVDGIFGVNTKNAVRNYQTQNGLVADGIIGRKTWAKINGETAPSSQSRGLGNSNRCGCSYDYAGSQCSGGPTRGAQNLKKYLQQKYGSRQEIYNCRNIAGTSRKSLHAEGRAVDHYVTGAQGTEIFNHLISIACRHGIQEVIYNRKIWTSGRNVVNYSGSNPHTDHVHVGLNKCGAESFAF